MKRYINLVWRNVRTLIRSEVPFLNFTFDPEKIKMPANKDENQPMDRVIQSYLDLETNYALLINGQRGIGKTYYVKNHVVPTIRSIKVQTDLAKTYKPIYISLYGIKSIDEVYTMLAIEFMPWLKNKRVKIGLSIGKLIIRGLLNLNGGGEVESYLKDLSETAKNAVDTKEFVIIFDDLDRISISMEVGEIVGFINSLVEHENNKIIIIADEEPLNSIENYTAVREKTIGTVVEYSATFSQNFDSIVGSKYDLPQKAYFNHLIYLKDDILDLFERANTSNLRTLIYFLQHFQQVFNQIKVPLELEVIDPESLNLKKIRTILRFSLAVSIEFKKGKVSYHKPNGIDDMRSINEIIHQRWLKEAFADISPTQRNPDKALTKSYQEQFIDTYFDAGTYEFYNALYEYFTGGGGFQLDQLLLQLTANFDDKIRNQTPQELVYEQLGEPGVFNLSNEDYIRLTDNMIDYASKGGYPLDKYLSLLYYLGRFPEIKKYNIAEETEKFIQGIYANKENFQFDDVLPSKFDIEKSRMNYDQFLKLFRAVNEVNSSIKADMVTNSRANTFDEFRTDPDLFYRKSDDYYSGVPLFQHWNFNDFYSHFESLQTSDIKRFMKFLTNRFLIIERVEQSEFLFLESLFDRVQKVNDEHPVTIRSIVLGQLGTAIHDIITRNFQRNSNN